MSTDQSVTIRPLLIRYNGARGDHPVRSTKVKLPNSREFYSYGMRAKGDVFEVDIQDAKENPTLYLAPSGQPYQWTGWVPIDPLAVQEPIVPEEEPQALEQPESYNKMIDVLTGLKGIGVPAATRLIAAGYKDPDEVRALSKEQLVSAIGMGSANLFLTHQKKERQKKS